MKRLVVLLIIMTMLSLLSGRTIEVGDGVNGLTLLNEETGNTVFEYNTGVFETSNVRISGSDWAEIYVKGESQWRQCGYPSLPMLSRSVIIPATGGIAVEVLESEYIEFDIKAAPSKGILSREIDPSTVPYSFDDIYTRDEWFPATQVEAGVPYIFRDHRGVSIKISPFAYNGAAEKLRVYTKLVIAVKENSESGINEQQNRSGEINREFAELYKRHFINYTPSRYETISEEAGRMLIISYGDFMEEMQPFIDWKIQKGIATSIVDVSTIGNNSTSISNFIQSEYEQDDGLVWVLLVGDGDEVATKTYSGAGGDPQYTYLEGNDSYSEIFLGRFSAESTADVATQVARTIYYERDIDVSSGDWIQKGTGIASSQGSGQGHYGEADYVHIGYIRDDLIDYGYTLIDEIYDTTGANASMVSNAVNEGRGIINYCGHGSNYSWVTTGFNVSYVNALTNDYMLPFIQSIACVNGNFTGRTCFAEAWLRATNGDAPTGAVAMFAASINQSWSPPMYAQDESIDLMCAEELNTVGGLWFNGVSYMLDESGSTSMAKTWHIFGDPSLQVRSKVPEMINADIEPTIMTGQESYTVPAGFSGALASLSYDGEIISQAYSGADGNAYLMLGELPDEPVALTLTITGYNKVTQVEEVQMATGAGAYLQMLSYNLESGVDNEMFAGEYASLGLTVMNLGTAAAEDVTFTLTCASEYITISDNTELVPQVEVDQMLTIESCFAFSISEDALNGVPIILGISAETLDNSWSYSIGEVIYAPAGIVADEDMVSMALDIGEIGSSELCIKNNNYSGNISYMVMIDETTGSRNLTGSTLSLDTNTFVPGETVDWVFTCENNSPDWEWIKDIQITFPMGVIVNTATDFAGGSDELVFMEETGNGAVCSWHGESSTGWGYLHNGEVASATVNVTIMPGFAGNIDLGWELTGDDYGSDPHVVSGEINLSGSALPVSWLTIDTTSGNLVPGEEAVHVLSFDSSALTAGLYTADIIIANDEGNVVIPVEFYVDMGMVLYGDVDDNGLVESYDSSLLLQYVVGLEPAGIPLPWEAWRIARADVDGNGAVESYDSALILQYVVEIITEFPAETGRDHVAPLGECDVRIVSGAETWLEFYARGDVYSLDIMSRTHDFVLGEPVVDEDILIAYNANSNIYRYAMISAEPVNRADKCLRIPVRGYQPAGDLELSIKVNGYETVEHLYLGEDGGVTPAESCLLGNYPNPFNPETTIEYSLAESADVILDIYNIKGQRIRRLVNSSQKAGYHQAEWSGSNDQGEECSSGTYFYLLRTGSIMETGKMILLK